jgi:hypothetical protein
MVVAVSDDSCLDVYGSYISACFCEQRQLLLFAVRVTVVAANNDSLFWLLLSGTTAVAVSDYSCCY